MKRYETEIEIVNPQNARLVRHADYPTVEAARAALKGETRECRIYEVRRINRNRVVKFPVAA